MQNFNVTRRKGKDSDCIGRNLRKGTRYTLILSAFLTLYSCSAYYHTKQAEKHAQKAVNKGATVTSDTTFVTVSDTLTEIDTVDNYIRITKTIRDTVRNECKNVYIAKSKTEVRQENRTERKRIKEVNKTERRANRQRAKTNRTQARAQKKRFPFWLLIIGFILGIAVRHYWQKLKTIL